MSFDSTLIGQIARTNAIAASETVVTLMEADSGRRTASIYNYADKSLFVRYKDDATLALFKYEIIPRELFNFPEPVFQGKVTGIWAAGATGYAMVSEEE